MGVNRYPFLYSLPLTIRTKRCPVSRAPLPEHIYIPKDSTARRKENARTVRERRLIENEVIK